MNRRDLLLTAAASAVGCGADASIAAAGVAHDADKPREHADGLNPIGIRTSGIRMVPVVNGKYKVWTKKLGAGPIKVLLLRSSSPTVVLRIAPLEATWRCGTIRRCTSVNC